MKLKQYLIESSKVKWEKKWWNTMVDKNNKKVYSYTTSDGHYTVEPTGEHPTKGYAHKDKRTFWRIWDNKSKRQIFSTYTSQKKAKDRVEQDFYSNINEGVLDNVLSMGSKFLYFWKNKWIINTAHGLERIIQRNMLSVDDLKRLFKEAIEKALELGVHTGEEILFWSKSLKQGFVSAIDPQGNIKLITFLPKGKHTPKDGTEHIVVEGKQIRIIEID